ncbi:MAG TPA: UDP-N-acetylglucosamine 2-epimerase (non-hydrolyzing) [Candidatus Brocadiia bacterium]|nr:UDP-N-acetylglucosamine 2-epimerase (non-hydrolyzing) [Candidatus Brocadiia bacterium]
MKIACIVGARPNFMKVAPILEAMKAAPAIKPLLIHTGQHYSPEMSRIFFDVLNIPKPDINLEVGGASRAQQTAAIISKLETVFTENKVDRVMVVGDVTSTMAAAVCANAIDVPVDHVEAGLRSFDISMPEEHNRRVTDTLSSILFCSEPSGIKNLKREGRTGDCVKLVGNVMIDTQDRFLARAAELQAWRELGLPKGQYGVLTAHRPSNVDTQDALNTLVGILEEISQRLPLVFPVHPRTRKRLEDFGLLNRMEKAIKLTQPIDYLAFMDLVANSKIVLTDSGGLQEETTSLGIPCLTLRENTERPITVTEGTSTLVGLDRKSIVDLTDQVMAGTYKKGSRPKLWDGHAAERIVGILAQLA